MVWISTDEPQAESRRTPYVPLLETARLYAGWLLVWYAIVFLLAGQRAAGRLPLEIPWLEHLAQSPLVLRVAFATFLFLLLSSIARWRQWKTAGVLLLTLLWISMTIGYGVLI